VFPLRKPRGSDFRFGSDWPPMKSWIRAAFPHPSRSFDVAQITLSAAFLTWLSLLLTASGAAQEKNDLTYIVGPRSVISVTNNYGAITVKPSGNFRVIVTTDAHANVITFMNEQHDNRIELRSSSSRPGTNLVDYTVLVPADACLSLRSSGGSLHVEGLNGDLMLESVSAPVEVSDITDAHLHVKTVSGPIRLKNIRDTRIDIHSVNGDIDIRNVSGPSVEASSQRGRISFEGDPGPGGEYLLFSHFGNLDVSIPARAPVQISTIILKNADSAFASAPSIPPASPGSSLVKPGLINASRFVVRSFSGKIHLTRP